jgi:hypothetical protein
VIYGFHLLALLPLKRIGQLGESAGETTYLHLLDLLTEGSTVTGSVLSGYADLLCALRHFE